MNNIRRSRPAGPIYSGGNQERTVAEQYHDWTGKVSGRWPGAGDLLEGLVTV
jgi:hypothetical protein